MSEKSVLKSEALLEGLAFSSRLRCASIWNFVNALEHRFEGTFTGKKDFARKIDKVVNTFSRRKSQFGEKEALELMTARDLEKINQTLSRINVKDPTDELHVNLEAYKRILNRHGVDVSETQIFIVDSYPYPYTNRNFMALNCDIGDEKYFNIRPGIYFKRTRISPLLSSGILAHELIHACFSKVSTERLARGLEDGLCDLMGLYLSSKTLGSEIATNMLLNQRLSYPSYQFDQIYADALRQAVRIYNVYGLKGLIQILEQGNRKGRIIIKQIEEKCIRGRYSDLGLDNGDRTVELDNFANYFIGFPTSMVASPLACYIAEKVKTGDSVKEIIKEHNINPRDGRRAAKQLDIDLYLMVTANGRIICDETKAYVKSGTLRYAIKPT